MAMPTVRYPDLLEALVMPIQPYTKAMDADINIKQLDASRLSSAKLHRPAFSVDGVVNGSPALVAAMVREPDATPLAGDLVHCTYAAAGEGPAFHRVFNYASRLPFPFKPRSFAIESWFLTSDQLPPSLADIGAVCYISQTPVNNPATDAKTVAGDCLFSGYLFVPIEQGTKTLLRRVISIDLNAWMMKGPIERNILPTVYRDNHVWMNNPDSTAIVELEARKTADIAYITTFGAENM
eukprot:m.267319 g.267319  ORF g.267319 m.267319 type:complete len:238 (+) comp72388_c0_seq1:183-896(+)